MIKNPSDRMIPFTTFLPDDKFQQLPIIIKNRTRELKKMDGSNPELSLWLMDELDHIRRLYEFNANQRTKKKLLKKH